MSRGMECNCAGQWDDPRTNDDPAASGRDCHAAGLVFRCVDCGRATPWCCGAADKMPEHCDECWARELEYLAAKRAALGLPTGGELVQYRLALSLPE